MFPIVAISIRRRRQLFTLAALSSLLICCLSPRHQLFPFVTADETVTGSTSTTTSKTKTASTAPKTTTTSTSDRLSLDPIVLTSTNFATTVNDGNVWLIEFYTSWCKHCQNFKTSYDNVALTFHSSPQEKIRVAKVDCTVEKALSTRFGVKGFPSFYLVSGWSVYEFEGSRSESGLISFARGGYKKQDPIPWVSSPMGPMGLLQGTLIYIGTSIMGAFDTLQTKYSIPPVAAGVALCMIAVFGGMISIVLLTIISMPREKVD